MKIILKESSNVYTLNLSYSFITLEFCLVQLLLQGVHALILRAGSGIKLNAVLT